MLDTIRWLILLVALAGWVSRRQLEVTADLREANHVLKEQLGGHNRRIQGALSNLGHPDTEWLRYLLHALRHGPRVTTGADRGAHRGTVDDPAE